MQYRLLFLVLLMTVLIGNTAAQRQSFRVHFNTGDHLLDHENRQILDQLIAGAQQASYYEIHLTAHTDSDAGTVYNSGLSKRRAASVKQYLLRHHIRPKAISSASYGESKPGASNESEEGKASNRRVEIALHTYEFHSAGDLLKHVSPDYRQEFTIDPSKENTVKAANGTTILIPADALLTRNGKPVTGPVNVIVKEFLKPSDAAFNQLSTMSEGRMLESGGMFSVQAFASGEELELKKEKTMQVTMPTINMRNNMTLFTAVTTKEGVTEWKQTNVPFRPNIALLPPATVSVKLDTKKLNGLLLHVRKDALPEPDFVYKLPVFPKRPQKPAKEPRYNPPAYSGTFSWWELLIYSKQKKEAKFEEAVRESKEAFASRMAYYLKQKAKSDPLWEQYRIDSARFEQETLAGFREWLSEQEIRHEAYARYREKLQWNNAIHRLIGQSNNNQLTSPRIKERFLFALSPNSPDFLKAYAHEYALLLIAQLRNKSMHQVLNQYSCSKGLSLHYADYKKGNRMALPEKDYTFAQEQLTRTPELIRMLDLAGSDLAKKLAKAREFDESKAGNVYATTLSSFGTFNCDRFSTVPPNQMVRITVPYPGDARVAFFVPELNSYMQAHRNDDGYWNQVPAGTTVKVVFVAYTKKDGPLLEVKQVNFTQNGTVNLHPKSVTLKEMNLGLASL